MRLLPRLLSSIVVAACVGMIAFVATVNLILLTDPCDRRVHTCDIAPIAGYGIGIIVGPVVSVVVGFWHDWRSWSFGIMLGVAFTVARKIVLHRPSLMRPPLLIAVLCVVRAPLNAQAPGKTVCPPRGVTARGCLLRLARRAGTFQVPPLASIGPLGKNPDGKEIVLEDSTVVNVWVTDSPATGGMASSGSGIDSLTHSATVVSRHRAEVETLRIRSPRSGAWHYVGSASIKVDSERAVNLLVQTATPRSRDAALRALLAGWTASQ